MKNAAGPFAFTPSGERLVHRVPKQNPNGEQISVTNWIDATSVTEIPGGVFSRIFVTPNEVVIANESSLHVLDSNGIKKASYAYDDLLTTPRVFVTHNSAYDGVATGSGQCMGLVLQHATRSVKSVLIPPVSECRSHNGRATTDYEIWEIRSAGRYIATRMSSGATLLWENPAHLAAAWMDLPRVKNVRFLSGGRFVSASSASESRIWEAESERSQERIVYDELTRLGEDKDGVTFVREANAIEYSASGALFGVAGRTGAYVYWPGKQNPMRQVAAKYSSSIVFSPDDRYAIVVTAGDAALLLDMKDDATKLREWRGIRTAAFSPDGRYVATGGIRGAVRICRIPQWDTCAQRSHPGLVSALAFSEDGTQLASGTSALDWEAINLHKFDSGWRGDIRVRYGDPPSVKLWSAPAWELTGEIGVRHRRVKGSDAEAPASAGALLISRNKGFLAIETEDGWGVWTTPDWRQGPVEHNGRITAIAFSPDEKYVITGGDDQMTRIWRTSDWRQSAEIRHTEYVTSIAIHPNGRYAISASSTEIHGFLITSDDLIRESCRRVLRDLTDEEVRFALGTAPYSRACRAIVPGAPSKTASRTR